MSDAGNARIVPGQFRETAEPHAIAPFFVVCVRAQGSPPLKSVTQEKAQRAGRAISGPAVPLNDRRALIPITMAAMEIVIIATAQILDRDVGQVRLSRILILQTLIGRNVRA